MEMGSEPAAWLPNRIVSAVLDLVWLRRWLRSIVPLALRRYVAISTRAARDKTDGHEFAIQRRYLPVDWAVLASITQPLIIAPYLDQKRANLAKAIGVMQGLIIKPGQTLSVWHCLGPPTQAQGWASGRTIINDVMTTDPGGGLCQFSSLIYHLGLLAGLTVIERHHHSRDIYTTDAARFTPLGLDATIVYGFKDLRMRNDRKGDLVLGFELTKWELLGRVLSLQPSAHHKLSISRQDNNSSRTVIVAYVHSDGTLEKISDDVYQL
jgi:vancomycin resistance protein VanW